MLKLLKNPLLVSLLLFLICVFFGFIYQLPIPEAISRTIKIIGVFALLGFILNLAYPEDDGNDQGIRQIIGRTKLGSFLLSLPAKILWFAIVGVFIFQMFSTTTAKIIGTAFAPDFRVIYVGEEFVEDCDTSDARQTRCHTRVSKKYKPYSSSPAWTKFLSNKLAMAFVGELLFIGIFAFPFYWIRKKYYPEQ